MKQSLILTKFTLLQSYIVDTGGAIEARAGEQGIVCKPDSNTKSYDSGHFLLRPLKNDHSDPSIHIRTYRVGPELIQYGERLSVDEALMHAHPRVYNTGRLLRVKEMLLTNKAFAFQFVAGTRYEGEGGWYTVSHIDSKIHIRILNGKSDCRNRFELTNLDDIEWNSIRWLDAEEALLSNDKVTHNRVLNPEQNTLDLLADKHSKLFSREQRGIKRAHKALAILENGHLAMIKNVSHRKQLKEMLTQKLADYKIGEVITQLESLMDNWDKLGTELQKAIKTFPLK